MDKERPKREENQWEIEQFGVQREQALWISRLLGQWAALLGSRQKASNRREDAVEKEQQKEKKTNRKIEVNCTRRAIEQTTQ